MKGVFLSINGWSNNALKLLKQNPNKVIILMDGPDLRTVLEGRVDLGEFILAKVAHLGFKAEPYLSSEEFLKTSN